MKKTETLFQDDIISLREVIDFLPDPLLISRFKGKTHHPVYLNQKFRDLIGYTLRDIPDIRTWFEKAYPNEQYREHIFARWEEARAQAARNGSNYVDVRARIHCKDNVDRWFSVRATFWKKDIYIVVFSNIDEIKQKNTELDRLNKLKDKLFSVISHDLRSPLSSLKALLSMLDAEMISEEEIKAALPSISQQLHNVSHLLETLLNWARSQLQKHKPNPVLFEVGKIIRNNIDLLRPEARRKEILLEELPINGLRAYADTEMTSLVVRNLIANAIKFTPRQGKVLVSAEHTDGFVVISVADTGVGMTAEQLRKIMNKETFTLPGTANEKGTGLGLMFCHEFVLQNGGKFWVSSELDRGSTFSFSIPVSIAPMHINHDQQQLP